MTKIKICGLFKLEDIAMVNAAKPDYIGFIMNYEKSHRNVSLVQAKKLKSLLHPTIKAVGVFVNSPLDSIKESCDGHIIDIIQLHGNEDENYIQSIRAITDKPIIKAFIIKSKEDIQKAVLSSADYILLDGGMGTGTTFSYELISEVHRPFFLAGGIKIDTMAEAIAKTAPFAIDISSGVETDKVKDAHKIHSAVRIAHTEVGL